MSSFSRASGCKYPERCKGCPSGVEEGRCCGTPDEGVSLSFEIKLTAKTLLISFGVVGFIMMALMIVSKYV